MKTHSGLLFVVLSAILLLVLTSLLFILLIWLQVPLIFTLLISANILVYSILMMIKYYVKIHGRHKLNN